MVKKMYLYLLNHRLTLSGNRKNQLKLLLRLEIIFLTLIAFSVAWLCREILPILF